MEAFKQAIRIKPDLALAHLNLGVAYGELGRYQDAIESYKQVIRINPDYAEAHLNLGVAYGELGRYQDAIESYKQAIGINPDLADAHNNLGVAYGKLGRYQDAIESFKQAIRINPDFADAHSNLGIAYSKLGRYQKEASPYSVVDQQLTTLRDRFAEQAKRLRDTGMPPEQHNKILAGMQADYDEKKYKIMDLRGQLDGIQKSITDGSVDPDLGKEAMWRLVLPPEHAAAMFPKQEKGRFGSEHTRSKGR